MKYIILLMLMRVLPICAQEKVWSLDVSIVLPSALAESARVQINPSNSAWVLVQNATTAKLVRVGKDGLKVEQYSLPTGSDYYAFRISSENKCVIQSGRLVTTLTYKKIEDTATGKKVMGWEQKDITLIGDDEELGLEVAYDHEAQRMNNHVWYLTQNAAGVLKQVVLRKVP